ncbi:SDR family oxidoreductase [Halomonas sp. MCCC 1A17488]|uniref:SDR family oxidoreductase n=1 Tax=unclassified Halomonas TaxID=2609666 RepID=UPI0018D225C1|nr:MULTISPECIES: SDR family oxidoreductase [unclassified Halomonas]MCE8017855.1 SDR family oxidoreductase [Halomonas sp. MCCC 1A17488]MCG3241188.1 SDR family oxidoreductase [Halomonas sp. MCCC 1A17488]QPP49038.1 SDR family oxidoreductase [Halomonas sp. SS10-MC5]
MSSRVLITGANRGIGLALARHYHGQGWRVVGACRATSAELDEVAEQVVEGVDVTRSEDVARLAEAIRGQRLDVLVNNAGLLHDESLGSLDFATIQRQMEVNAYGPLRVTEALLDNLGAGSKVANVTSRMGSIADNDSGGRYGYRASKAALNAFGKSLAIDLKPKGIAVAQLHPGYVQTRMVDFGGLIPPEEAAAGIAARIAALTLETSGGFWHSNGEALPW